MPVIETARSACDLVRAPLGHRRGDFAAHGAVARNQHRIDAEHLGLGVVRIGDEGPLDDRGGPRNLRQQPGDQAARAGFGRHDVPSAAATQFDQRPGLGEEGGREGESSVCHCASGRRTVAAAWAAMPSLRPVKPNRSVVVALIETEPSATPAMAAMR